MQQESVDVVRLDGNVCAKPPGEQRMRKLTRSLEAASHDADDAKRRQTPFMATKLRMSGIFSTIWGMTSGADQWGYSDLCASQAMYTLQRVCVYSGYPEF